MDPTILVVASFAGISLLAGAVLVVARGYYVHRASATEEQAGTGEKPLVLRRRPSESDLASNGGIAGRIDQWFGRLVQDAGTDLTPLTAFLLALAAGLAVGGSLFVWRDDLLAGVTGLLMGMGLVVGVLLTLRARRWHVLLTQLPEVVDLMARSVRAGQSLEQAVDLVGTTTSEPWANEFRHCAKQLDMGLSLEAVVQSLTQRIPLSETRILAATLIVQRKSGGDLPTTLERLARVFRDRLNYRRQLRAATAVVRSSVAVIVGTAVLAAAYAIIWRPAYAEDFLTSTAGQTMLAVAVGLQAVGIAWVIGLLRTDY
ncbi:MAG TPA: type II secretion system F family protein [Thermoguttaceae bacterium]|nr:type II secretion system F family protein [Thermoguttaceae bacterium]